MLFTKATVAVEEFKKLLVKKHQINFTNVIKFLYTNKFFIILRIRKTFFYYVKMNKKESFNIARHQYIKGYHDNNEHIFPTLDLVAKEFSLTLSTLRKKAANEGWYKTKQFQNIREEYEMNNQFKGKYSKLAQISRNTSSLLNIFCQLIKNFKQEKKNTFDRR